MAQTFTLAEARALVPQLRVHAGHIVRLRADLAEGQAALRRGVEPPGGMPALKAAEAHLQEAIDWFSGRGIQLKGIAPLIADLPGELDGEPVLWCWLEGETTLGWYHAPDLGFLGRRALPSSQ